MRSVCSIVRKRLLIPVFMVLFAACSVFAADNKPVDSGKALSRAWDLYAFQEFESAGKLFVSVEKNSTATDDQKLQAKIGSVFVVQYQQPGGDPVAAMELYSGILKILPEGHKFRALVLSRIADCYISKGEPEPEEARKYFRQAIDSAKPGSILCQESVMQYALTYLSGTPSDKGVKDCLAALDGDMSKLKGGILEGAARNLASGLANILGDDKRMEKELEAWIKAGIQNFTMRAKIYFMIARLNELKLNNAPKAIEYYERLAKEEESDRRAYFAKKRAEEIRQGKLYDGDLALPKKAFDEMKKAKMGDDK